MRTLGLLTNRGCADEQITLVAHDARGAYKASVKSGEYASVEFVEIRSLSKWRARKTPAEAEKPKAKVKPKGK